MKVLTMRVHDVIERKLTTALMPTFLSIIDESDRHRGHAGVRLHGESHFRLVIVSERFRGMQRMARQRMVYNLLKSELDEQIHAISMQTLTRDEERDIGRALPTSRALKG